MMMKIPGEITDLDLFHRILLAVFIGSSSPRRMLGRKGQTFSGRIDKTSGLPEERI